MKSCKEYKKLRAVYQPDNIQVIFILESPPESGKFFYDPTGKTTEPLFSEIMKLIGYATRSKDDGLRKFKEYGFLLVDASYVPVDGYPEGKKRNREIMKEFPLLLDDLEGLCSGRRIPLILVKTNICRLLELSLKECGFKVLNNGIEIPYLSRHLLKFRLKIKEVLKKTKKAIRHFIVF